MFISDRSKTHFLLCGIAVVISALALWEHNIYEFLLAVFALGGHMRAAVPELGD